MLNNINGILILNIVLFSAVFIIVSRKLRRTNKFSFDNAGFWFLIGFLIYFIMNPFLALVTDNKQTYQWAFDQLSNEPLQVSVKACLFICIGTIVFCLSYTKSAAKRKVKSKSKSIRLDIVDILIISFFVFVSFYSIVKLRLAPELYSGFIEEGKILGGYTGYLIMGHLYIFSIIIFLLMSPSIIGKRLGITISIVYILLRLRDPYDRASILSLLISFLIIASIKRSDANKGLRKWQDRTIQYALSLASIAILVILVARGHSDIETNNPIQSDKFDVINNFINADTAMLPYFYVWTAIYDKEGYEYGIPLINKVLLGWLPRRVFPWKDDLTPKLLGRQEARYRREYMQVFIGPKASIFASFYSYAGVIGLIIGMYLFGLFSSWIDTLVHKDNNLLAKSLGICYLSFIWIVVGSNDTWGLSLMFSISLPFILIYLKHFVLKVLDKNKNCI